MLSRVISRSLPLSRARMASTLVIGEHTAGALNPATLSAVSAAKKLHLPVHALVFGDTSAQKAAGELATVDGVDGVDVVEHVDLLKSEAERVAPMLKKYLDSKGGEYVNVVGASSTFSKNFFPRLAALLDVSPLTELVAIKSQDTFVRPIYAGNALTTIKSTDALKLLTVRPTNFSAAGVKNESSAINKVDLGDVEGKQLSQWSSSESTTSDRPDLQTAKTVISGGRAMKNGDNFKILYSLADKFNAAVGASRAAVDAGFVSNDLQVGQTGKVVAPDLYIAVGISGAIQHIAGMKDSKCIVAINNNAEAPIFQIADYGLVADLFAAVPELEGKL